jgi:peptide/nickel transport system substrate-binding protein
MWSDGTPLTSADVKFTWEYCTHPEGGCAQASSFDGVESVEAVDDLTIVVNFEGPTPVPLHRLRRLREPGDPGRAVRRLPRRPAQECTEANFGPIGTGPFVVDDFRPTT